VEKFLTSWIPICFASRSLPPWVSYLYFKIIFEIWSQGKLR